MPHDPGGRTARLTSIDTLRGIVMILMALDHVRDYFGVPGLNPVNLAQTTVPLFLTRWVTHLCAPTFFLLTGTSAFLAGSRRSTKELSRFLFVRGVWLIVLELTVVRCLGMQFNVDYQVTMLIVIWALGWAMIVLAALVWLPTPAILVFGVVMVAGHNLLDGVRSAHPLWVMLHAQGIAVNRPGFVVFVAYPLVPWVGVTALGYALGQIYEWNSERRRAFLLRVGLALVAAFVLLRTFNGYGNPVHWATQASTAMTIVSFLNVTKQPPSLLFLLMTLGAGTADASRAGPAHPAGAAAGARLRPRAALLLRAAPAADPPARGGRLLRHERRRALDVRVAQPRRLSVHAAAGVGTVAARDLLALGGSGRDPVSGVRVVRIGETAPARCGG